MQTKTAKQSVLEFRKLALKAPVTSIRATLSDGLQTTLHIVRHEKSKVVPRVVVFDKPTVLLDWCLENGIENAMVGGFDLHHGDTLLGEIWTNGKRHAYEEIAKPWDQIRACLHIDKDDTVQMAARKDLPKVPGKDLVQTGPLLVRNGKNLLKKNVSPEGFSQTAHQFTPDPSVGRHPRAAIGHDDNYYWTVVCDARFGDETGLTMHEMAEAMVQVGAHTALNLDGGSSTQLVRRGKLLNRPWGQHGDFYPEGFPISSAIYFEPLAV